MVNETKDMGMGIYAGQDFKSNDTALKFNLKKIYSSDYFDFGLFFTKTLTLQHRKIPLPKWSIRKQKVVKTQTSTIV